jgi:hypothetical protein
LYRFSADKRDLALSWLNSPENPNSEIRRQGICILCTLNTIPLYVSSFSSTPNPRRCPCSSSKPFVSSQFFFLNSDYLAIVTGTITVTVRRLPDELEDAKSAAQLLDASMPVLTACSSPSLGNFSCLPCRKCTYPHGLRCPRRCRRCPGRCSRGGRAAACTSTASDRGSWTACTAPGSPADVPP